MSPLGLRRSRPVRCPQYRLRTGMMAVGWAALTFGLARACPEAFRTLFGSALVVGPPLLATEILMRRRRLEPRAFSIFVQVHVLLIGIAIWCGLGCLGLLAVLAWLGGIPD